MAKDRSQRKGKDKFKEKSWYTLLAPEYFGGKEISLSVGSSPESMIGRKVEVPVSDFTGNFKRANAKMVFRVSSCQGTKCSTEFLGHALSDDYIRRMVRRRKERIDIVHEVSSSEGSRMVLKIVIVTDGKLNASKRVDIRNSVLQFLDSRAPAMTYGDLAKYVIGDEIYGDIIGATKDIYPIRKIELRKSALTLHEDAPKIVQAEEEAGIEQTP